MLNEFLKIILSVNIAMVCSFDHLSIFINDACNIFVGPTVPESSKDAADIESQTKRNKIKYTDSFGAKGSGRSS